MYINNPGHITKMTTMPIYGKNPSKIVFSGTGGLILKNLGYVALVTRVLRCVHKSLWPWDDLVLFYSKVSLGMQ